MSTSKISVIIAHEYLVRVRSKWFILATLFGPLVMALFIVIPALIGILTGDGQNGKIGIHDGTGIIASRVVLADTAKYVDVSSLSPQKISSMVMSEQLQAYVDVQPDVFEQGTIKMYSRGGLGATLESGVNNDFERLIVEQRLLRTGTDTSAIRVVNSGVKIESFKMASTHIEEDTSEVSAIIGYAAGFAIYILIFLYGTMVMRGVVDEKANRIVEIIASSARPFQIMLGKVVGIGLVGLTQLVAWLLLGGGVVTILTLVLGVDTSHRAMPAGMPMGSPMASPMTQSVGPMMVGDIAIPQISIFGLLAFLFYFLCGYFIYATLFAAVGSAVDQESDANQLTFPVTMPVIITMMCIPSVVAAPNGMFAVVMSFIPLFAPIVMTVRIAATDVPWWHVAISMALCVGGLLAIVWLASRIYRIGILSYGRKPTLKEVIRWITVKV